MSVVPRLEAKAIPEPNSGCLLWTGALSGGYGRLTVCRRSHLAHRLSWEVAHGPIPDGLLVCHKCDVPSCINPAHLFLGTDADNVADKVRKGRHPPSLRGEAVANVKLTEAKVRAIRADPRQHRIVAAEYGVSKSLISVIRRGEAWRHVDV